MVLINFLEWLTEFRETLMFTSLLKDVIKDTDGQPGEVRYRRVSSAEASVFLSWGLPPFCHVDAFTYSEIP